MRWWWLLLVAGCAAPDRTETATVALALSEDVLGALDAVRVTVEPGEVLEVGAPLPDAIFVPLAPGVEARLTVVASLGGVERWLGASEVPALRRGEQTTVAVVIDAVGRVEARVAGAGAESEVWVERDGARRELVATDGGWTGVVLVGTWRLRVGRPGARPQTLAEVEVAQGEVTAWSGEMCAAVDEVCGDGVDDDCDGEVDEGCGGCVAEAEVCNGADDDCDTRVDEGVVNACGGCGALPEEVCDGIDNDCDSAIDEGVRNACGGCGEVPEEVCDGADDDCDGVTDEGVSNVCGGCGEVPEEVCDGVDNDCDGVTDEGLLNACEACGEVPVEACNLLDDDCDGQIDEGAGGVELCDGVDNDCDERVDEGACPELCNGLDDDLDGAADEGLLNACGRCGPAPDEVCNGVDDDCDGEPDEGFEVGADCVAGLGVCATVGSVVCDGPDATTCDAVVRAGDEAEACDGRDNDCDGRIDEDPQGVVDRCEVGVGACRVGGFGACRQAQVVCMAGPDQPAVPGDSREEACNGLDDDCDGAVDEACPLYLSCLDALLRGVTHDGPLRIASDGAEPATVWCDQTVDGGGWSLLLSTGGTPSDEGGRAHPGLATAAPDNSAPGTVLHALGGLGDAFDLRFACRAAASDDPRAPFDVDLTFPSAPWYPQITAAESASCFATDGLQPVRQDNLRGVVAQGPLVGEAQCDAPGDFAVDHAGGGIGALDDTSWGAVDGVRRCGAVAGADVRGQWLMFARERRPRASVAVIAPDAEDVAHVLSDLGLNAVGLGLDDGAALDRHTFDGVYLGGPPDFMTGAPPELLAAIERLSDDGGAVLAEDGAGLVLGDLLGDLVADGRQLGWYPATLVAAPAEAAALVGLASDDLFRRVALPVRGEGITTAMRAILETGRGRIGLRKIGFAADRDGQQLDAVVAARGRRCDGDVVVVAAPMSAALAVPELASFVGNFYTELGRNTDASALDVCADAARPQVRVCGRIASDVAALLPVGTAFEDGCAPDGDTQALLVAREPDFDALAAADLEGYVRGGGLVVTSAGSTDAVYRHVFGGEARLGEAQGACRGAVEPLEVADSQHWFWRRHRVGRLALEQSGCGRDVVAFERLVPLGGWGRGSVSLGYRDLGEGRVWVVETDWADVGKIGGASATMLQSMMRR